MRNELNRHSKNILKPDSEKVSYPNHKYSYNYPKKPKCRLNKKFNRYECHNDNLFQLMLDFQYMADIEIRKNYPIRLDELPNGKDFSFDFDYNGDKDSKFYEDLNFYWEFHNQKLKRAPRWRQIVLATLKENKSEPTKNFYNFI